MKPVIISGGGLAGSEAAWQLAERGVAVTLYEMRPSNPTPAHKTDRLAELVCSNSLKSNSPGAASWLLKEELRRAGSLLMRVAGESAVPGGSALAVDRERFAEDVTAAICGHPLITVRREELREVPDQNLALISTGPLTSDALAARLQALTGSDNLAFYDSISPVVDAETLNMDRIFSASRYGKGGDDYLNCPFTKEEYQIFHEALMSAETVQAHEFENVNFFESCLPIEELGRRGYDTLRFGPMKPVGLIDPRTNRQPFAVVQLRAENLRFSSYNLVGFQNHLKFPEQKRIMRLIPGLENAEFLRLGQIHRNTYINAPRLLNPDLSFRSAPQIFVAGQLSGVEGYVECISTGLLAGLALASRAHTAEVVGASSAGPGPSGRRGDPYTPPPRTTALGSLVHYITHASSTNYQPANISFDLLAPIDGLPKAIARDKRARREKQCDRALTDFEEWFSMLPSYRSIGGRQLAESGKNSTVNGELNQTAARCEDSGSGIPNIVPKSEGFNAVGEDDAEVLILGTLPGPVALACGEYYANPGNALWPIMERLFRISRNHPYEHRVLQLTERGIALWDVCASACRDGSSDSKLRAEIPNDFIAFLGRHPQVKLICFNGTKAARIYRRRVLPILSPNLAAIRREVLPSTSRAHAKMNFEEKLKQWRNVLNSVLPADDDSPGNYKVG